MLLSASYNSKAVADCLYFILKLSYGFFDILLHGTQSLDSFLQLQLLTVEIMLVEMAHIVSL